MLVLNRYQGEKIRIGDDIIITIVDCGRITRIGIEAPLDLAVHREEIYQKRGSTSHVTNKQARLKSDMENKDAD